MVFFLEIDFSDSGRALWIITRYVANSRRVR